MSSSPTKFRETRETNIANLLISIILPGNRHRHLTWFLHYSTSGGDNKLYSNPKCLQS